MRIALALLLAACTSTDEVSGPIGGRPQRFVVDSIAVPTSEDQSDAMAIDLDGDGVVDNVLGHAIAALATQHDVSAHGGDMIAAGRIASSAIIRRDGDTGAVWLFGDPGDDGDANLGGFDGDRFRGNRGPTGLGRARIVLPVVADADPAVLDVEHVTIDLTADATGFTATLHGLVDQQQALDAASQELAQMIANDPREHPDLSAIFDANADGIVTAGEVATSPIVTGLFAPDQQLASGAPALSLGVAMHVTACDHGTCEESASSCFDRVQDGDEGGVDCGGSCALRCPAGTACTRDDDCDALACDNGSCRAATCTDGIADGREGDVDCGVGCPSKCARGAVCFSSSDCASAHCSSCSGPYIETCTGAGVCQQ